MDVISRRAWLAAVLAAAVSSCASFRSEPQHVEVDVCVYGATSAGVIAAVQAARSSRSVA